MNKPVLSFREQLNKRMAENDRTFNNVYANIDISCETDNEIMGLKKLGIPVELIQEVHKLILAGCDFALGAEKEIVFFIGKKAMITFGNKTAITHFATEKDFENGLKLTILGHRELFSGGALNRINAYRLIVKNLSAA